MLNYLLTCDFRSSTAVLNFRMRFGGIGHIVVFSR